MRWAEAGDFPVRRVSGKKSASVWAYAHELDAWLAKGETSAADHPVAVVQAGAPASPFRGRFVWVACIVAGLVLLSAGIAVTVQLARASVGPVARTGSLPADPAVADLYLQARDDWSTRTPGGLQKAMAEFGAVASRDPGFAPAYAGLADSYILARDFDSLPSAIAFSKAEAAAKAALAIDPNSADANRALGFIAYWGGGDLRAARDHFARSIRIDPNSAQTHFWFGNILNDAGADDEGLRELRTARLLDPGSRPIQTDYAWALWMHGPGDPGRVELQDLADHGVPSPFPHRFLSLIFLSKGDIPHYLDQSEQWAALQNSPALNARVAAERAAFRQGGSASVLDMIANRPVSARLFDAAPTEWPATAASLAGHRDQLLRLLARADAAGERWKSWRRDQVRFAKWRGDAAVTDQIGHMIDRRPTGIERPRDP